MLRQIFQRFGREVSVRHHHLCVVQQAEICADIVRGNPLTDLHVRNRQHHVAVRIVQIQIARSGRPRDLARMTDVNSEVCTVRFDPLCMQIVSKGSQEPDMNPQQTQVMRNVPANTAKADGDLARIGIPCDQRPDRLSADVNVDTADHRCIRRSADHVSTACNMSLFHQVRDVHRHGRPRNSCLARQLFL